MQKLKVSQNKGARIVKEKKRTYSIYDLKNQLCHYKGLSYFMASAPVWISKYQVLIKAV